MQEVKEIINWADEKYEDNPPDWSEIITELKKRFKVEDAEYIAIKEEHDYGYKRKDPNIPNVSIHYAVVKNEDLYDYLDDLCQGEDCKNGVQLNQHKDGTYEFFISGSNFYDGKTGKYAGTDEVRVYLKEFVW